MTGPRVLLICDLGPHSGAGHLMRCLALAEEFETRGYEPVVSADVVGVPFALAQVQGRGYLLVRAVRDPTSARSVQDEVAPALVVVDSYELCAEVYRALRAPGAPILAIIDGEPGDREADIYVTPNLGGEQRPDGLPPQATHLGGIDFTLLRNEVLDARTAPEPRTRDSVPELLLVFGATDPFGAATTLTRRVAQTGLPFRATVVADHRWADQVRAVRLAEHQEVKVVAPTARLATTIRAADAVLSAAGISVWELMFLGAPTALVWVAENQRPGYERVTRTGAVMGLGALADVRDSEAPLPALTRLLEDTELRARLSRKASRLVDGRGRTRVVDATLRHLSERGR